MRRSNSRRARVQNLYVYDVGSRLFVFPAGKSAGSVRKPAALPTGARRRIATENGRCAPDAENPCRAMTGAENSVVTPATFTSGLRHRGEAEMRSLDKAICSPLLTHDQLQRELTYRFSIAILRDLRDAGLLNGKEFVRTSQFLAERFSPVWGGLYQDHG